MKVLILSTYGMKGGAAIAANRLGAALYKEGVDVSMVTQDDFGWKGKLAFLLERIAVWVCNGFSMKNLWAKDFALVGVDITSRKEYKAADVIHLHWINQGFISLRTLEAILRSDKRVVWTMHDEWPLSGMWHYYYDDTPSGSGLDVRCESRKREAYRQGRMTFVTCSKWLADKVRKKPLGAAADIRTVPNPIDTLVFRPLVKEESERQREKLGLPLDKKLVLFGCQYLTDERKGFKYLLEAAKHLDKDVAVVLVGGHTEEVKQLFADSVDCYAVGQVDSTAQMAALYGSVDCFVTPSLHDNLPNMIMESMACGIPCVGFNVGGIPEMIDHGKNGYVAELKNAEDLAAGIRFVVDGERAVRLKIAAREKVMACYSEHAVAEAYMKVYKS